MDYSLSSSCRCGRGFAGSGGWLQGPGASRGPCQGGRGAVRGRCPNISGTAAFNQPREERVQLQPKMKNWTDRAAIWPPLSLPLPLPLPLIAIYLCKSHLPNLKTGLLHKELLAELFVKQNKTTSIFQNKNNQYILQSV